MLTDLFFASPSQVLSCVQTKSDERHKITYKVNVKMRLDANLSNANLVIMHHLIGGVKNVEL